MGAKYTDAHRRATNKYRATKSQITISIDKAVADSWRAKSKAEGMSLTKWIVKEVEHGEA